MVRRAEKGGNLFASLDDQIEAERLAANRYFKNTGKSVENFADLVSQGIGHWPGLGACFGLKVYVQKYKQQRKGCHGQCDGTS